MNTATSANPNSLAGDDEPTLRFILKWLGILVGLAGLCLVAVGLLLPRQWEVEVRAEIEASPEAIHAQVSDVEGWDAWMFGPEAEAAGMTIEATGQGAGAIIRWTGGGSTGEMEVVESDVAKGIRWDGKIETDEVNSHGEIRYEVGEDGVVTVILTDTGELPPVFGGYLVPVMNGKLRQHFQAALGRLEAQLEGPPAVPPAE